MHLTELSCISSAGDSGGSAFPYLMGNYLTSNTGFTKAKKTPNENLSFFHTLDLESSHRTYPISACNLITLRGNCSEGKQRADSQDVAVTLGRTHYFTSSVQWR